MRTLTITLGGNTIREDRAALEARIRKVTGIAADVQVVFVEAQ